MCNKIWVHIYFYASPLWACKVKPTDVTGSWSVWTETSQSQCQRNQSCLCLNHDHVWWQKDLAQNIDAVVEGIIKRKRGRTSAYLPGCVSCVSSAATPSTGHTVWLTCCCSRAHACGPIRRTAWVPAAGWGSAYQAWDHMSHSANALRGKEGQDKGERVSKERKRTEG